jgi:opacity protein-like surface antigen
MKHFVFGLLAALGLAATVSAAAPSVAGDWTMTVEGTPHGTMTMGLTLKQDGTRVTGTFVSGHAPDMEVAGEFVDGQLRVSSTQTSENDRIIFAAKLRDDGTLSGTVSGPMGDMTWTASRAAAKNGK